MAESIIIACNCKSDKFGNTAGAKHQDKLLGTGMRYYTGENPTGKKKRCTVCGREK